MAKIKFACRCGKSLSADEMAAGKKAKCPNCGQIVTVPAAKVQSAATTNAPGKAASTATAKPKSPAPPSTNPQPLPPAATNSIWDDDLEGATEQCSAELGLPSVPAASPAVKKHTGLFAKLANRPWWFNWIAFFTYLAVVWLVSRTSPMGSLLLVMPVFFLAVLIFLFGGVWYFLVLMRDDPAQATTLFFALLKSFVFGSSATKAGYQMGQANRGKPANPSHARPISIMKFGALGFAFSMGATLIVGILLGTWTKENFRRARFRDFERSRPPMQRIEPQPPPVRFR